MNRLDALSGSGLSRCQELWISDAESVPNKSSKEKAWTGALRSAPFVPSVLAAHCRLPAMSAFDAQSCSNISSNLGIPQ